MSSTDTYSRRKLLKCTKCDFTSKQSSSLKKHIKSHNFGKKLLKCKYRKKGCGYSCSKSETMEDHHYGRHSLEKRWSCRKDEHCHFKGYRKTDRDRHHFRHTAEKPIKCKKCLFSCTRNVVMKSHAKMHSEVKQSGKRTRFGWICPSCNSPLCDDTPCLKETRYYSCDACESPWCDETKDKPCSEVAKKLNCSECDYIGSTKFNLKRHMKTHTTERPFKCTSCDYTASRADYLEKHRRRKKH